MTFQYWNLLHFFIIDQILSVGEGFFCNTIQKLVQFLPKAKHVHKPGDIYCRSSKPSGYPNAHKHLWMEPALKHTARNSKTKVRLGTTSALQSLARCTSFRYSADSALSASLQHKPILPAWRGLKPAVVHAGYTTESTVKTTVSAVKCTPKLVLNSE